MANNKLFTQNEDFYQKFFPITTHIILNNSKNDPEFVISWFFIFTTAILDILLWSLVLTLLIFGLIVCAPILVVGYVCRLIVKINTIIKK